MNLFLNRLAASLIAVAALLSVFTSTAQASWSGPVYAVTNRQGDIRGNVAATTPNSGDNAYPSVAQAGTVKATFTWVHDVPGDAPPSDVYVLQSGKAQWQLLGPPPAGTMSQPSASIQSAAFSFGRKPRIYLAQTQTVWGTADDGLGHAQVVTTTANGQTGTSQGYKPVLCHPAADGTLVTSAVTLSASATSKQTYVASWSYSAQIMALQMTRNGVDITNPNKPEVPVMVGERNQMGVSVSPVPQDIAPPTFNWTLPTDGVIKDYIETAGNPNAVPPTPFTGKKVELPAGDSTTQSPHFYWYNGSFAGDSKEISVVVTIAGTPITLKGKCKVYRPSFDGLTVTYQKQKAPHETEPMVDFDKISSISFTPLTSGAKFAGVATVPNTPTAAGQIGLQQIVSTFNVKVKNEVVIPRRYQQLVGVSALDTKSDDQIYATPNDTRKPITPGTNGGIAVTEGDDTPNQPSNQWTKIIADFSFTMYLMYKPTSAGSIWVPLGKNDWGWGFDADDVNFTKNWSFNSRYPTVAGPVGNGGMDTHDFPQWDIRAQDAQFVPIAPW